MNKYELYEIEKQKLKDLPNEEYQKAIKELADKLNI